MLFTCVSSLALVATLIAQTNAHGALVAVKGANGVDGQGFGIIADTPRDGSRRNPFQQDTSIIRQEEIANGEAGVCGRTLAGGSNDVPQQLDAAAGAGLPSADAGGQVTMTLHQVNGDGAGPYSCDVSPDGGNTFQDATVVTNVPGVKSRSRTKATDFPLVVQMPANLACTAGPAGDACIVRCMNVARAGPFGGCVAITMDNANANNANNATEAQATANINNVEVEAAGNNATNTDIAANNTDAAANNTGIASNNSNVDTATGEATGTAANGAVGKQAATGNKKAAKSAATANASANGNANNQVDTETEAANAAPAKGTTGKQGGLRQALANFRNNRQKREMDVDEDEDCFDNFVKRRSNPPVKKRLTLSRVAGKRAGWWIDA